MTASELTAIRTRLGLSKPEMAARIGRSTRRLRGYESGEYCIPLVVSLAVDGLVKEMGDDRD